MYGYMYLIYDLNGWLAVVGSCMIVSMKMMIGGSIWCFDVLIDMSKREQGMHSKDDDQRLHTRTISCRKCYYIYVKIRTFEKTLFFFLIQFNLSLLIYIQYYSFIYHNYLFFLYFERV